MTRRENDLWLGALCLLVAAFFYVFAIGQVNAGTMEHRPSHPAPPELVVGESFTTDFSIPFCFDEGVTEALMLSIPDFNRYKRLYEGARNSEVCTFGFGEFHVAEFLYSRTVTLPDNNVVTFNFIRMTWNGQSVWSFTELPVKALNPANVRKDCRDMRWVAWFFASKGYITDTEVITDSRFSELLKAANAKPPVSNYNGDTAVVSWHPEGHVGIIILKDGCGTVAVNWHAAQAEEIKAILRGEHDGI